jgi:hypothetical protein
MAKALPRIGAIALVLVPAIASAQNDPPPVPVLVYPDGDDPVGDRQPTIILDNAVDPNGDTLTYFIEVDSSPCFCTAGLQSSGPLAEGGLLTQWKLPRPLPMPEEADRPCEYLVRRWVDDGELQSAMEVSSFELDRCGAGGAHEEGDAARHGGCATAPTSAPHISLLLLALVPALTRRR